MGELSIDVVVPIHGGYALTASCLEHLRSQPLAHRVVVVDDASPDDAPDRIEREFPETLVLRQTRNRGFAAACNRGIAASAGDVVVLLNNDVDVRADFLEQLVAPLGDDDRLGCVAALLVRPDGRAIDSLGLTADRTGAGFARLQGAPVAAADGPGPPLLGPSGGAAAYRRRALDEVGGLDEEIFMYQEDLDLALRLRGAGWGAAAAPRAVGVHHGSATAQRRSARQRRTAGWSRGYLLRRYGVLGGRAAPRALLTELIVVAADAVVSRDLAALGGRLAGWRAASGKAARSLPGAAIADIGFAESLRLRRADYAAAGHSAGTSLRGCIGGSVTCPICGGCTGAPSLRAPDRLHGSPGRFAVALCPSCETGVTLPPLAPAELAAAYPEGYGPYGARPHPAVRAISALIQRWQGWRARHTPTLEAVAALAPGRGIDVGCGRGDLAAMLVGRGWRMTGIDPSASACAIARERGVETREGVLAAIDLEPAAFDAAIFNQSLEHTDDPLGDLRRIRAALRPGGVVVISVPNFGCWQARRFGGRWFHLDLPRHRVHFTGGALRRALDEAGFEEIRTATSTSLVGLPASIQYRIWGRCLFSEGMRLRVASALCALGLPLARAANAIGGGDVLHATARRPA